MKKPESAILHLADANAAPVKASEADRTISGLAVPYGPVGHSSMGAITFSAGSLFWTGTGRVKLLKQHDPERVLGFATKLEERPEGLWAEFQVAEGDDGDLALAEAADGRRDGLSVGVFLSDETLTNITKKWAEGDNSPTAAAGELLEVSQVSIPAFRDSRISGSVAASNEANLTLSVQFGGNNEAQASGTKETQMEEIETSVSAGVVEASAPAAPPAAAGGAATVVAAAPVYTFNGQGPSFVRDSWNARFGADVDAMQRLQRFGKMMKDAESTQAKVVTAAVETRTTAPEYVEQGYRPDLLIKAVDRGRPLVSALGVDVRLTDATPFRIPSEGEFSGVGDHTEGTAHVAEGTLTAGDALFTPGAISGAYRVSRELVDASNPAIDKIALNAMIRDYRRASEAKVAAALAAADGTPTLSVDTVMELRAQLNNYSDLEDVPADFVLASKGFFGALISDVDTTGRPLLPSVGPVNTVGQLPAGYTGTHVDGTNVIKASSLGTDLAYLVQAEDVLIGESNLETFRFDEVEGPGVIKLALWAYFGVAVLRPSMVVALKSAAA